MKKVSNKTSRDEMVVQFEIGLQQVKALVEKGIVTLSPEFEKELLIVNRNKKRIAIERLLEATNELYKLIQETIKVAKELKAQQTKKPIENSTKKPIKKDITPKKAIEKKEPAKEVPQAEKADEGLTNFPATINVEIEGETKTLTLVKDKILSCKAVQEALEQGIQVFIACYWSKKLLKQFDYASLYHTNKVSSFPNDLDILQPLVFCETLPKLHASSLYTEAMLQFNDKEIHTIDKNGERWSNGMNFQMYICR